MNITVYLGSASGNHPKYAREVIKLGTWIGKSGHRLIYGGSRIGLMGELAEAVLQAGGEVIGIEPGFFVDSCEREADRLRRSLYRVSRRNGNT